LPRQRLDDLLVLLRDSGYRVIGPQLAEGAVVYRDIGAASDLPAGVTVESGPGSMRVIKQDSPRQFAWANGPQALKPRLFKPAESLWQVQRDAQGRLSFARCDETPQAVAVIGVRACDLAALRIHDQHFLESEYRDPYYARRRERLLLVAVNCTDPATTCFCASTGDGPAASGDYDLLLDELEDGFLVTSGSPEGQKLSAALALTPAPDARCEVARAAVERAAAVQTRRLPPGDLFDRLFAHRDHPRWSEVANRCLACGNCTQVCPTCFCSRERDETPLDGASSVHQREWDSCFTEGHSYIHGLVIRAETRQRYRQWLTHKLGSWHRQFGRSGCVGCGRCILWCPVGIDITEEVHVLMQEPVHD